MVVKLESFAKYVTWKSVQSMIINKVYFKSVVIVQFEGYLDMGTFREFELFIQELIKEEITEIGIDLSKCRAIDSSGMGCILRIMNNLKAKNKRLTLLEVPTNIKGILKISQVDKYLKIESLDEFKKTTN